MLGAEREDTHFSFSFLLSCSYKHSGLIAILNQSHKDKKILYQSKTRTKNCLFFSFLSLLRNKLYIKYSSAISYMEVQIVLVWRALPVFRLTHFSTDPYNHTTQLFYIYSKVFQLFLEGSKFLMKVNNTPSPRITCILKVHH